jgi:CubicO group peptidase (beta-lactamase class C family)
MLEGFKTEMLPSKALAKIEAYVQAQIERAGIPGASLAIVQGARVLLAKGFGTTEKGGSKPVTPDTLFQIGSLTKSFTAVAILQLRDRGLIDLDASVQRYLPWFRVADEQASTHITVRHLLNHTSGIPTTADRVIWQTPKTIQPSLEEGVRALRTVKLHSPPNVSWQYANMGYNTLGLIVEVVSGQPYPEYIERHILKPLGMGHSTFDLQTAGRLGCAEPYWPRFGRWTKLQLGDDVWLEPAGGKLFSTARDMAQYASVHLGASPVSVLAWQSLVDAHSCGVAMTRSDEKQYAFGWIKTQFNGTPLVWHNGGTAGYTSAAYLLPEKNLGVVLLLGAFSLLVDPISLGVVSLLLGQDPAPVAKRDDFFRSTSTAMGWVTAFGLAILAGLALFVFVGGRVTPHITVPLIVLAGVLWLVPFVLLRVIPTFRLPTPFVTVGVRGWPLDILIAYGMLLLGITLWALYAVSTAF